MVLRYLDDLLTVHEAALAAARRAGNRAAEGRTLDNLGDAYQDLRWFDEAVDCWREAAAAMRGAGDHEEAARLEQQAASAQSPPRCRWGLRAGLLPDLPPTLVARRNSRAPSPGANDSWLWRVGRLVTTQGASPGGVARETAGHRCLAPATPSSTQSGLSDVAPGIVGQPDPVLLISVR